MNVLSMKSAAEHGRGLALALRDECKGKHHV
jgi:hypothetical protein